MPIFVLRLAETAESRPFETPNSALSHKVVVPDRDSCNLVTLVATMIVNSVQVLLSARGRFHPL